MSATSGPAPDAPRAPAVIRCNGATVPAEAGRDLLTLLLDHGVPMDFLCMGGTCGTCRVRVLAGAEHLGARQPGEDVLLPARHPELRLACQAEVLGTGDVTIAQP